MIYKRNLESVQRKENTDTHVLQFNRQVENGAIKRHNLPCGRAVILHHAKTHGHRLNIWTERHDQKYTQHLRIH